MRDLDEVQAHEYEHQKLVEEIIRSLHEHTHDNENYREEFRKLAMRILPALGGGPLPDDHLEGAHTFFTLILTPIREFTTVEVEQKLLLMQVLQKILGSIATGIISEYQEHEDKMASAPKKEGGQKVILSRDVRLFQKIRGGNQLTRTTQRVEKGAEVTIGEPRLMEYDHRNQIAAPVELGKRTYWMLVEEMGLDFDEIVGIEKAWIERAQKLKGEIDESEVAFFAELKRRAKKDPSSQ